MKITNEDKAALKKVCESLAEDAVELIDFDMMHDLLVRLHDGVAGDLDMSGELELLKNDYRRRILGMLRAIDACGVDQSDISSTNRLAGDIGDIGSEELIQLHRRVGARFRSCFPASFRQTEGVLRRFSGQDWKEHKI